jgi:uncharacterized membrane protein YkgB
MACAYVPSLNRVEYNTRGSIESKLESNTALHVVSALIEFAWLGVFSFVEFKGRLVNFYWHGHPLLAFVL